MVYGITANINYEQVSFDCNPCKRTNWIFMIFLRFFCSFHDLRKKKEYGQKSLKMLVLEKKA